VTTFIGGRITDVLKQSITATGLVGGRIFDADGIPLKAGYPFVAVRGLQDSQTELTGDASFVMYLRESIQCDIYFKSAKDLDPQIARTIVQAIVQNRYVVNGEPMRFRVAYANRITPEPNDTTARVSLTFSAHVNVESM
jgi:hypothetical protein